MKTPINTLLTLFLTATALQAQELTRDFEKTIDPAGSKSVTVDHSFGDIQVFGWEENRVEIKAVIKVSARKNSVAEEFLNGIEIVVTEKTDQISIETVYPDQGGKNISYSVDYRIRMPIRNDATIENSFGSTSITGINGVLTGRHKHGDLRASACFGKVFLDNQFGNLTAVSLGGPVELANSNGDIEISKVAGNLDIENRFGNISVNQAGANLLIAGSNGDIQVSEVKGEAEISNSFGNITMEGVTGSLIVNTRNGDLSLSAITGASINAAFCSIDISDAYVSANGLSINNQNGDISLEKIKGNLTVRNSFGAVEAKTIDGGLEIRNQNASVTAEEITGPVTVSNTFGSVELCKITGPIKVQNQNGSVEVTALQTVAGDIDISATFGGILIELPRTASVTLSATTSFGGIDTDFDLKVTEKFNKATASGVLGDGKHAISLKTQNAGIEIRKTQKN
ncbi:MAG: DUF4097 family beta strand repeat-containing protein [Bacteroidetes bacterium]|nr:DUF4097 family beta strand repeat-containing protein [Bacteroidota bacterium]